MAGRRGSRVGVVEVELPGVMDIQAARPLHGLLQGLRGRPVVLEGSGVQRVGGQCLQVLLAAGAAWAMDGKALTLAAPSAALEEGLALLGFTPKSLLGKEAVR